MTSSTIEATVRLTLNNVRLIKLSRGTCTVHLGVCPQSDDRSSICIDKERLGAGK